MWRTWNNQPLTSDKAFYGQNPPNGAMINFYLKEPLADREAVTLTFQDSAGTRFAPLTARVRSLLRHNRRPGRPGRRRWRRRRRQFGFGGGGGQQCTANKGLNRFVWDMRWRPTGIPQIPAGSRWRWRWRRRWIWRRRLASPISASGSIPATTRSRSSSAIRR